MFVTRVSAIICLAAIFSRVDSLEGRISRSEALNKCSETTGLKPDDIIDYRLRNEMCSIDCITRQGHIMTSHEDEGKVCHDDSGNYQCSLGTCSNSDEKTYKGNDLYSIAIKVIDARVPDMDPYPGQGESDAFVSIAADTASYPNYDKESLICYTHVIQDNAHPNWQNFQCKPLPIHKNTRLRFTVWDSDKPTAPEKIGEAVEDIENLYNNGPTKMLLRKGDKVSDGSYYVTVDVSGKPFSKRF